MPGINNTQTHRGTKNKQRLHTSVAEPCIVSVAATDWALCFFPSDVCIQPPAAADPFPPRSRDLHTPVHTPFQMPILVGVSALSALSAANDEAGDSSRALDSGDSAARLVPAQIK